MNFADFFSFLLLGSALVYIVGLLSNPNYCWFHPEMTRIHLEALETGSSFSLWSDLRHVFDFEAWEWAPRPNRPLASAFSIFDAKFRVALASIGVLHPSISLTWIVLLLLIPGCLLTFLWREGVRDRAILAATLVVYFLSTSTLGLLVMFFRPSKSLSSLVILLNLLFAQKLFQKEQQGTLTQSNWNGFCLFQLLSYFVDETAVLSFPVTWVLFPSLVRGKRRKVFLLLPFGYLGMVLVIIPAIAALLGYPWTSVAKYRPAWSILHVFRKKDRANILWNSLVVIRETLNLFDIKEWKEAGRFSWLGIFSWLGFGILCLGVFITRRPFSFAGSTRWAIVIVLLFLCHAIFMGSVTNGVWGNYWYGSYFVLIWAILLAIWTSKDRKRIPYFLSFIGLWAIVQGFQFPHLNQAWYKAHFFPYENGSKTISDIYRNQLSRFLFPPASQPNRREWKQAFLQWVGSQDSKPFLIPLDLYYLPITKEMVKIPAPWGYELGDEGYSYALLHRNGKIEPVKE